MLYGPLEAASSLHPYQSQHSCLGAFLGVALYRCDCHVSRKLLSELEAAFPVTPGCLPSRQSRR